MVPNYNPDDVTSWFLYVDGNNLYGGVMACPLPTSGFGFISEEEISDFDLWNISPSDPTGYVLDVDLEYPREMHDLHSDYP